MRIDTVIASRNDKTYWLQSEKLIVLVCSDYQILLFADRKYQVSVPCVLYVD